MARKLTEAEAAVLLKKLGERRQRHLEAGERLAEDIRQALADSEGQVSRTNAAQLLGMDRTTLYTTYLNSKDA